MTVKVGIIGTSWWADAMYLPALVNSGAEVVALCGRNTDRLTQMADQWKIPGRYTDYTAMLDTAKLDAVIISATNDLHHPMTLAALERNLHVLCEKPLALNYALREAAGAQLCPGQGDGRRRQCQRRQASGAVHLPLYAGFPLPQGTGRWRLPRHALPPQPALLRRLRAGR